MTHIIILDGIFSGSAEILFFFFCSGFKLGWVGWVDSFMGRCIPSAIAAVYLGGYECRHGVQSLLLHLLVAGPDWLLISVRVTRLHRTQDPHSMMARSYLRDWKGAIGRV